jgi:phytoene/squalene synthetase
VKDEGVDDTVRRADYDRFLSALFARAETQPHLFALYAFHHEIAKTAETVSQPTLGLIRLQWWRETVAEIYEGRVREHAVARAFARTVRTHALPRGIVDAMIEAREADLEETPFASLEQMENYADATSGNLMRLAARILGAGETEDALAREAGIAYALAGLLRALPFRASRRNLVLPMDALRAAEISPDDVFTGKAQVAPLIAAVAERALAHHRAARHIRVSRRFLPAFLPVALVPLYVRAMTRPGFDPFRDLADIAPHRRQWVMLRAMVGGRV